MRGQAPSGDDVPAAARKLNRCQKSELHRIEVSFFDGQHAVIQSERAAPALQIAAKTSEARQVGQWKRCSGRFSRFWNKFPPILCRL